MAPISLDASACQLNNGYSIQFVCESNCRLTIELYHNQVKTSCIVLNNDQCSTLTHRLCETVHELHELLIDLLLTAWSPIIGTIGIHIIDGKQLKISFPIHFGSQPRTKLWSFAVEFSQILHVDDNKILHADDTQTEEISLDPLDWNETRLLGHQIMDDMIDYLRDVRLRPAWRPVPLMIKNVFAQTNIPLKGQSPWEVYDEVCSFILPYALGNIHPHFWGYVPGAGSLIGALAEFITGTMDTMAWGGNQASTYIEHQVLSWLKILMDFPNDDTSSGVLVSGTSVATIIALAVARKKFQDRKMKVYYSKEVHSCFKRAIDLLDIGKENCIVVPTNAQRQIDLKALEVIIDPHSCGFIVGTAGTTGTGAIDDLQGLADLCASRPKDLWFHIDGALGAVARCSLRLRSLFPGFDRADSLAFDLHKWLPVPYECGCVLIRDGQLHLSTFAQPHASYLTLMDGGLTPSEGELFYSDYGLELSRNMKSLKVWMTLKTYGLERIGQAMEQNVDQAMHFAMLIQQHPNELELLNVVSLNIVCFRYVVRRSTAVDLEAWNKLNKRLLITIQERGIAVASPFVIHGDIFALRVCLTNHRTMLSDMYRFVEQVIEVAREIIDTSEFSTLKDNNLEGESGDSEK